MFSDPSARRDLDAIIHPPVYRVIDDWFTAMREQPATSFAIADVPLLYETSHQSEFTRVIGASCTPEQQLKRLVARGGLSPAEARQRIESQMPIGEKVRRADDVIDTSGTLADTDRQGVEVYEKLRALGNEAMLCCERASDAW